MGWDSHVKIKEINMCLPGYYEFCCGVKIIAGHNVLEDIPHKLSGLKASKPMIITDKGVSGAGLIDVVSKAIKDGVTVKSIEDDVPPDSDIEVVHRLAHVYRKKECDSIIAVGGGSVLDTAKAVNILVSENADDLMKFAGSGALKHPLKPLVAIPTTSGTGSEVTLVAVIADHKRDVKMLFPSNFLLPDIAVIDSRMTLTLPPHITAATGMDALSHAVESYTCLSKNPLSDAHAMAAINLICQNIVDTVKQPDNPQGRLALAVGANLAGIAFSNSMVGIVHALGHSVGAVCGVPHGNCMAILLPYGLEYNFHKNSHYTAELLMPFAGTKKYAETPKHQKAQKVISRIRQLNQELHDATGGKHPRFLNEIMDKDGNQIVPKSKLQAISRMTMGDGTLTYNPEEVGYDDALKVLQHAWDGTALDKKAA
jgi:alcohol dehydrogenase